MSKDYGWWKLIEMLFSGSRQSSVQDTNSHLKAEYDATRGTVEAGRKGKGIFLGGFEQVHWGTAI